MQNKVLPHSRSDAKYTAKRAHRTKKAKKIQIDGIIGYESHETFKKGKVGTRLSQEVYALKKATTKQVQYQ